MERQMEMLVRQAHESDFNQVSAIFADENAFHSQLLPERFQIAEPVMTQEWFGEVLANENKALLVAEFEGVLVGLVLVHLKDAPDEPIFRPRRYAYIDEVAVQKAYRGRGIGRQLMTKAHEWIAALGVHEIELYVWEDNQDAIRFYERLGYRPIRRMMKFDLDI